MLHNSTTSTSTAGDELRGGRKESKCTTTFAAHSATSAANDCAEPTTTSFLCVCLNSPHNAKCHQGAGGLGTSAPPSRPTFLEAVAVNNSCAAAATCTQRPLFLMSIDSATASTPSLNNNNSNTNAAANATKCIGPLLTNNPIAVGRRHTQSSAATATATAHLHLAAFYPSKKVTPASTSADSVSASVIAKTPLSPPRAGAWPTPSTCAAGGGGGGSALAVVAPVSPWAAASVPICERPPLLSAAALPPPPPLPRSKAPQFTDLSKSPKGRHPIPRPSPLFQPAHHMYPPKPKPNDARTNDLFHFSGASSAPPQHFNPLDSPTIAAAMGLPTPQQMPLEALANNNTNNNIINLSLSLVAGTSPTAFAALKNNVGSVGAASVPPLLLLSSPMVAAAEALPLPPDLPAASFSLTPSGSASSESASSPQLHHYDSGQLPTRVPVVGAAPSAAAASLYPSSPLLLLTSLLSDLTAGAAKGRSSLGARPKTAVFCADARPLKSILKKPHQ